MSERITRELLLEVNKAMGCPLHTEPSEDERDAWSLFADAVNQRLAAQPSEAAGINHRHPNPDRDKLAAEAIFDLDAIEKEKPKALAWLIKWMNANKLHPSQDACVYSLATEFATRRQPLTPNAGEVLRELAAKWRERANYYSALSSVQSINTDAAYFEAKPRCYKECAEDLEAALAASTPAGPTVGFHACFYCANSHQFAPDCMKKCECACHENEPKENAENNEAWRLICVGRDAEAGAAKEAGGERRKCPQCGNLEGDGLRSYGEERHCMYCPQCGYTGDGR